KYSELIQAADFYDAIYLGDYKGPYQFQKRDLWFIEKSDACLILMDPDYPESTYYFHKLAEQTNDYPIMYITPSDIEEAVEEIAMIDPDYWIQHIYFFNRFFEIRRSNIHNWIIICFRRSG